MPPRLGNECAPWHRTGTQGGRGVTAAAMTRQSGAMFTTCWTTPMWESWPGLHVSGHGRFANSRALTLAGIDATTPDPKGGHIVRGAEGHPTGLLHEAAAWPVRDAIPKLTAAELQAVGREAVRFLNGLGITGFCDASATREMLETFRAVDDSGDLTCWAGFTLALHPSATGYDPVTSPGLRAQRRALCGPRMIADFAKIFLDGVPSLRTAAM